ncbi:hypothetical protein DL93DRAFT_30881 [Clavulina sp. PMI_390]|nr:hypothetical protein DL93DRAFT_30881 [Clavulina sp. PMI_390]
MGSEAKPKSSKRVELRAQTYEDLKQYSYTLRALRTQAIQDSPSYTLDILKAKRNSNDASRTTDHARYGDGGDPALGSLVPAPSTSTVDLPPRAEATPPFVEGGPEFMTLWPDRKALSYVPEWSFEEEIEALLRISYQTDGKRVHVPMLHDHPSEDADPELAPTEGSEECVELTSDLVTEVADHIQDTLTDIFSYLALHRPQEPPERALYQESMGWDQVLNALHGSGIVPQKQVLP